jgi:hypothetical protein
MNKMTYFVTSRPFHAANLCFVFLKIKIVYVGLTEAFLLLELGPENVFFKSTVYTP